MVSETNQIIRDPAVDNPTAEAPTSDKSHGEVPPSGYFAILFYLLIDAMETRQDTVLTQSKVIAANSAAQERLNKRNGAIKFSVLPEGAKETTINRIGEINQQRAALRENIQSELITCRQNAQVEMTQTTTNVNILQQDSSENTAWLKTLSTIFHVINEVSKR